MPASACELRDERELGVFNGGVSDDFNKMLGRSVANRRRNMALAEGHAEKAFAEYPVEAGKPFHVFAMSQLWTGPTLYEHAMCRQVASLVPQAGHDYELVFNDPGIGAAGGFRLYEIVASKDGGFARQERAIDPASQRSWPVVPDGVLAPAGRQAAGAFAAPGNAAKLQQFHGRRRSTVPAHQAVKV